jgi:hypothetical protein
MTASNNINITCKKCEKKFSRLEYMTHKTCENPNCTCPEVARLRQQAKDVIEKARLTSNVQAVKRASPPTGYIEDQAQYMVDVPDVMTIDIIVPKTNFGHKRRK